MKSRSHHHKRNRWAHCNTPEALRRRRAAADARREAIAALMPPRDDLAPLTHWQRITIDLYVPTSGRCDQHAVEIDGERVGLLSATELGRRVAAMTRKRPALAVLDKMRREEWSLAVLRSRHD